MDASFELEVLRARVQQMDTKIRQLKALLRRVEKESGPGATNCIFCNGPDDGPSHFAHHPDCELAEALK